MEGMQVALTALELGCELTRNAEGSSAIMWFMANLLGFVFIICECPSLCPRSLRAVCRREA